MKKWETPAIAELNINATQHEWSLDMQWDGGYFGDGRLSGWFGGDGKGNDDPNNFSS